jgi:murein DD-endopeptidase MepM/ murein hydrolase activator NlpD
MSWLLKGQTIALSGNTGSSEGPHCILNFEIVNRENYQSYALVLIK